MGAMALLPISDSSFGPTLGAFFSCGGPIQDPVLPDTQFPPNNRYPFHATNVTCMYCDQVFKPYYNPHTLNPELLTLNPEPLT